MNRSNEGKDLCSYIHRICLQTKLEGFDYCIRHILVDKNAPFKQCTFSHPITNKRCPNAARKSDRASQALCPWHIKKMFLKQKHQQLHQQLQQNIEEARAKREGLKGLLLQLEHYSYAQDPTRKRVNINWVKQDDDNSITASDYLRNKISEAAIESLDQESDEELSNPMLEDVLRPDLIDSDSENFDSDQDDPLKHAGVYTAEEVSLILRDKMLKLQSLYIGQFKHLQYLLREKYKKYLQSLQDEKEAQAMMEENGEFDVTDSGYSEEDVYRLRALVKYHRYRGPEALLKDKAREKRRALLEGENFKPKIYAKCIFNKDGPCQNQALPLSHYCKSHILFDANQVLFRPCAAGEPPCLNPVISIRRHHTCIIHSDLKQHNSDIDKLLQEFHEDNHEKQSSPPPPPPPPQTSLSVPQEIVSYPEPQISDISLTEPPLPPPPPPIIFNEFETPAFSSQENFKPTIETDLNTESQETISSCQSNQNLITPDLLQSFDQPDPQPEQMDTSNLDETTEMLPSLEPSDIPPSLFPLETFTDANFTSTINPDPIIPDPTPEPSPNPNFNGTQI